MSTPILTITGPTCSGKSTLVKELEKTGKFHYMSGFTTRAPRQGEVNGVDYHFLTMEQAAQKIRDQEAVEHVNFNGNYYGILKEEVIKAEASGKIPMVILEPNGMYQFKQVYGDRVFAVFLWAPLDVLIKRFLKRTMLEGSGVNLDYTTQRLLSLLNEHESWGEKDFSKKFTCTETTLSEIVDFLVKEL